MIHHSKLTSAKSQPQKQKKQFKTILFPHRAIENVQQPIDKQTESSDFVKFNFDKKIGPKRASEGAFSENNPQIKRDSSRAETIDKFAAIAKKVQSLNFSTAVKAASQKSVTQQLLERTKKRKVQSMKMPMDMLKGIRKKKIQDYKAQQERQKQHGFTSNEKEIDVDFYLKKVKAEKFKNLHTEEKSYKFKGVNDRSNFQKKSFFKSKNSSGSGSGGSKPNHEGFMKISKRDIFSVNKK